MLPPGTQPLRTKPRHHAGATKAGPPRPPPSVSPHPWQHEGKRSTPALCGPLGPRSHFIRCQKGGNSSYHGKPPPQQQIQITPKKEESLITQQTLLHKKQNSWGKNNIPFHSPVFIHWKVQCLFALQVRPIHALPVVKPETLVSGREDGPQEYFENTGNF